MKNKKSSAFTILEALMSMAMITVIAGISLAVFYGFQSRDNLEIASDTIVQSCRRAQIMSRASDGDASWGVRIQSGSIVIFKGTNYTSGRDAAYDEIFDMPTNISIAGVQEVVFTKFTGLPSATGTTTLTGVNNETKTITLNSEGMASY